MKGYLIVLITIFTGYIIINLIEAVEIKIEVKFKNKL
jgi:hypothetical protein